MNALLCNSIYTHSDFYRVTDDINNKSADDHHYDGQVFVTSDSENGDSDFDDGVDPDSISESSNDDDYDGDNATVGSTDSFTIAPGSTALHIAIDRQKVETVKLLLQNGADMHIKDSHGTSALYLALSLRDCGDKDDSNKIIGLLREFNTREVDWEWKPSSRRE